MATAFNISSSEIENGKVLAGISYFGLLGFIIAIITSRDNRYVMFHAQQSLVPTLLVFVRFLPGTPGFLDGIFAVASFALFIIGLINSFGGKVEPLPLLGEFAYHFGICKPESSNAE